MADLIDMEKLLDQFLNLYAVRNTDQNAIMDEVCMMLIKAPHVDAVEVVRCMDCIHCDPENYHCDHYMGTAAPLRRKPDDFCSYGERKDGDGNG